MKKVITQKEHEITEVVVAVVTRETYDEVTYEANDGKVFLTEAAAFKHEKELEIAAIPLIKFMVNLTTFIDESTIYIAKFKSFEQLKDFANSHYINLGSRSVIENKWIALVAEPDNENGGYDYYTTKIAAAIDQAEVNLNSMRKLIDILKKCEAENNEQV